MAFPDFKQNIIDEYKKELELQISPTLQISPIRGKVNK